MLSLLKNHYMISSLIFLVLGLLVLRWLGERAYTVTPQPPSSVMLNPTTNLYQHTQSLLQTQPAKPSASSALTPLSNPHLALLDRMVLADSAQASLDVQYYLFHDDEAGNALLLNLLEAAKRGVKVRLLVDDMDMAGREGLFIRLLQLTPNLQIRVFNPFYGRMVRVPEYLARFPRVTRRMHNKSYTADGVISIVGGRNIGNEYFNVKTEVAFADLDLLVAGAIGQQVTSAFNAYWDSGLAVDMQQLGKPVDDNTFNQWLSKTQPLLQAYRQEMRKQRNEISEMLNHLRRDIYYADLQVIYDHPQKVITAFTDTSGNIAPAIATLMKNAQQHLLISSPYFIPGEYGLSLFQELRQRGVTITILTNSYAANDVPAVHAAYSKYRERLLAMGVQLFELKPLGAEEQADDGFALLGSKRASLHAKAFIVDSQTVFVGSFNLDPRSAVHNTEMGVIFTNAAYSAQSEQRSQRFIQRFAYQVSLDPQGRLQWHDQQTTPASLHTQEPDMHWWDHLLVEVIALLPVEWLM